MPEKPDVLQDIKPVTDGLVCRRVSLSSPSLSAGWCRLLGSYLKSRGVLSGCDAPVKRVFSVCLQSGDCAAQFLQNHRVPHPALISTEKS
jgi:hypothetical protein